MRLQVVRGPVVCGPFQLHDGDNFIGRAPECEVCLPSKKVSRKHAVVTATGGRIVVKDLESHNGVVDSEGRRVAVLPLPPGAKVQIGDFLLVFEAPGAAVPAEDEDDLDLDIGDDVDEIDLDEPVPLPVKPKPPRLPPDPGATGMSPLARPSMPPPNLAAPRAPEKPAPKAPPPPPPSPDRASIAPNERKVGPDDFKIRGLDPEPATAAPRPAAPARPPEPVRAEPPRPSEPPRVDPPRAAPEAEAAPRPKADAPKSNPNDIRIPGLDPDPPKKVDPNDIKIRGLDPEASRPPRAERGATRPPAAPAAMASAPSRPLDRGASVPRVREPDRPPAPLPRFEPVEVASVGVPWMLQAVALFGLLWAVIVCAPMGGLFSQKWAADARLDAATETLVFQIATTLAERNAQALSEGDRTKLDLSFATSVEGVVEARVADSRGMVLAPEDKFRISLGSREVFQRALADLGPTRAPAGGSTVEIVVPSRRTVGGEIVGWAFMVVDLEEVGRATAAPWWWWLPSAFVVFLVTLLLVFAPWYLFLRPLTALAQSVERAAAGNGTVRPTARLRPLERIAFAFNGVLVQARSERE